MHQPLSPSGSTSCRPASGMPALVSRLIGGAGVIGAAYYQPMALGGIAALALLLILGVVFPAVWSRSAARRRAAAVVLRLLLIALAGPRIATAAIPPVEYEKR